LVVDPHLQALWWPGSKRVPSRGLAQAVDRSRSATERRGGHRKLPLPPYTRR